MRILITGGSSGLGRAVLERLSENPDNHIFFTYCRKEVEARQLSEQHNKVESIKVDFTDTASVDSFVEVLPSLNLDVLVNNAWVGSPNGTYFHKTSISDFETSFKNNIIPLIKITQACLLQFRKQKSGRIVTVLTSSLLNLPPMGYSVYSATKAYVEQLSKCWCKENARFGIIANCISPEYMLTNFSQCG